MRRRPKAGAVDTLATSTITPPPRSGILCHGGVPILRTTQQTGKKRRRRRRNDGRIAAILVVSSLLLVLRSCRLAASAASSSSSPPHSSSSSRHHRNHRREGRGTSHSKRQQRPHQKRDYYDVLGADRHCTPEQLKKCYRKACLVHHPDKGGDEDDFKKVARAYQVLSDPQQRKLYDALGEAGLEQQPQPQPGGGAGTSGNPFSGGPFGGPGFTSFSFGGPSSGESPFSSSSSFFRQHSTSTGGDSGGGGGGGGVPLNVEDLLRELMMGAGGPLGGVGGAGSGSASSRSSFRGGSRGGSFRRRPPATTPTYERPVYCSLEELYTGATKKLKVSFDKAKNVSQLYSVHVKPGYKEGTKITFPAPTVSGPQMVFVIQEKPHPVFQRRGDDLVYRYKLGSQQPQQQESRIQLSIRLLDGTMWTRDIDPSSSVVRRGGSITVPNLGMPVRRRRRSGSNIPKGKEKGDGRTRDEGERGNLVIEFE